MPKKLVSQHLWRVNMFKGLKRPKHCLLMHGTVFVIFFDYSDRKSAQKFMF